MRKFMQLVMVGASVFAAAASATAPKAHDVQKSATVKSGLDETWAAVIDVFSDHNWTIDKVDKSSGLITTDWMKVGEDGEKYADCGSAPLATKAQTQVRFNVRVRDDGDGTQLTVNTSFRQPRSFGDNSSVVDCVSTGGVESLVQQEVNAAIAVHQRHTARKAEAAAPAHQEAGSAAGDTGSAASAGSAVDPH